jgi:hypothetical protein
LSAVILAKQIHETTGAACHPWEVNDYPDDWLTAIRAIAYDVPARAAKKAEQKWRRKSK